jgi:hypothetical protein
VSPFARWWGQAFACSPFPFAVIQESPELARIKVVKDSLEISSIEFEAIGMLKLNLPYALQELMEDRTRFFQVTLTDANSACATSVPLPVGVSVVERKNFSDER